MFNAVFNVLTYNRDDHSKNFSFLMDEKGLWRVSLAYDLTFSSGPAGEHSTIIMGEGRDPTLSHLLKLANVGEVSKDKAKDIIDQVISTVENWKNFAQQAGVLENNSRNIDKILKSVMSNISRP